MEQQELLQMAMMLKHQSEEVEKQLDFVSEQIRDMEQFSENLKALEESKEKEILSGLGRGVYMKTQRKEDEKLFIEVGAGVVVRKTPAEARKIVQEQTNKFKEAKLQLTMQLQEHADQFRNMLKEVEKIKR